MGRRRCSVKAQRKDELTEKDEKITVQIKYRELENTFSGTPEATWLLLNKFFGELLPTFKIANRLWLNIDFQQLAKDCEGLIAFSSEGPSILPPKNKLTDNETIALWLLASYVGHELGMMKHDALSKDDLQKKLGKSAKIASTRIGELAKNGLITKTNDERFKITTFGISQMQKETLPRIKSKANA